MFVLLDIIAIRDNTEEGADKDDFMSIEDEEAKKAYDEARILNKSGKETKKEKKKEKGVIIETDF